MSTPVLITGGAGFLGQLLCQHLLASDPDCAITVLDLVESPRNDVTSIVGDLADTTAAIGPILSAGPSRIFHLASMVSSAAEEDWAGAVDANIGGLISLITELRASVHVHQMIFASSVAVFGGDLAGAGPGDDTKQTPTSTYGTTKAVGELLINDATRKGFLDGRIARLPTVIVRPGKPNAAASSFCSGMFREPLAGLPAIIPVRPDVPVVVIGTNTAVQCLMALAELGAEVLGDSRAVSLPGLEVTVAEMVVALREVAGFDATNLLSYKFEPAIEKIVAGWPAQWNDERARRLELPADASLADIVRTYQQLQR